MCKFICVFFFFCKQKTAYEMRISDWSSDVCSSDLHAGDGLRLVDCRVTNAVRCVPPQNKPTGIEAANCRPFLVGEIETMKSLRVVLCLGSLAHAAVLTTLGVRKVLYPFRHGALHDIGGLTVADSYHSSPYNTTTARNRKSAL